MHDAHRHARRIHLPLVAAARQQAAGRHRRRQPRRLRGCVLCRGACMHSTMACCSFRAVTQAALALKGVYTDLNGSTHVTCGRCTARHTRRPALVVHAPACRLGPGPGRAQDGAGQRHHCEDGRLGCQRRLCGGLQTGWIHNFRRDTTVVMDRHRHQGAPCVQCHKLLLQARYVLACRRAVASTHRGQWGVGLDSRECLFG